MIGSGVPGADRRYRSPAKAFLLMLTRRFRAGGSVEVMTEAGIDARTEKTAPSADNPNASNPRTDSVSALVEVARGKKAWQSSYYDFIDPVQIEENDARRAVNGYRTGLFAFSTKLEDGAWWMVDLAAQRKIRKIVIYNRSDNCEERADSLRILTSDDTVNWTCILERAGRFGGVRHGEPLVFCPEDATPARYVRLQLGEPNILHLDQVEIYVSADDLECDAPEIVFSPENRLRQFCLHHDISYDYAFGPECADRLGSYTLISSDERSSDFSISAFWLERFGRFGNSVLQFVHAVHLARTLGVPTIIPYESGMFTYETPVSDGRVCIVRHDTPPPPGNVLKGPFFHEHPFARYIQRLSGAEIRSIITEFVAPALPSRLWNSPNLSPGTLVIHIRAGDLFVTRPVNPYYVQPPLAYYQKVIAHAFAHQECDRVCVVYEDRGNPCVNALEDYLRGSGIPFTIRSGELLDDMSHILHARVIATGFGSFAWGLTMLSSTIETVYAFRKAAWFRMVEEAGHCKVLDVRERPGTYIEHGEWADSPEQRRLMLTYPVDDIEILEPRTA
jgi:NedA-like, galactose-binding domain